MIVRDVSSHRHAVIERFVAAIHHALERTVFTAWVTQLHVSVHSAGHAEALVAICSSESHKELVTTCQVSHKALATNWLGTAIKRS